MVFATLISACGKQSESALDKGGFKRLSPEKTGITFVNQLTETEELNVLSYEYFYNGGGVAVGDVNGDGLPDLYFSGNMVPNKLYINKGGLKFEDVTEKAGVAGRPNGWNTGVNMVDINGDGRLDIYLCYSGDLPPDLRRNELYINNGDGTFTERAAEYGLDDPANTTHALFFDYDGDGDLDCYLLNHSTAEYQNFDASFVKNMKDEFAGDKLLRNDGGKFVDVTEAAGLKNNPLGFGLGVAASDLDGDGWIDLYISNDYIEEDYLYINNGDGTFTEELRSRIGHIPHFSMGSDIADFNNDGLPDILALDMLPEDNRRQKLLFGPDSYEKFQSMLRNGFYHQIMRNMLQLNNGDGTFSEIGQLAGVSNTDWSWAALFADFDNDGYKDLFISNGYLRDYTNRDFMNFYASERIKEAQGQTSAPLMEIISKMESTKTHNYIFRNNGDLTFSNKVKDWGFADPLLTNGAVYADLDMDGDLELILNNVNEKAVIYENTAKGNYLKVNLTGEGMNRNGIGAKVSVYFNGQMGFQEYMPARGFQSSMQGPLHFGLGEAQTADSVVVVWPSRKKQTLRNIPAGQTVNVNEAEATDGATPKVKPLPYFSPASGVLNFRHRETPAADFKRQALLPYMISAYGPAMAAGDVNGDGLEDVFVGGGKLQAGDIFLQTPDGRFVPSNQEALQQDLVADDVAAVFFDADGDGDLDLYVVSGGYDYLPKDLALQDRLYFNDGRGRFERRKDALPPMLVSGGCIAAADFDGDGDIDLFVGGRVIPGEYPVTPESFLLINDGKGVFKTAGADVAPGLAEAGMVCGAQWMDYDNDGRQDLILAGEWTPIRFFRNEGGRLSEATQNVVSRSTAGWWNCLELADLDGDGDLDIIAGNLGTNNQIKVSLDLPAKLYYADFDDNGSVDPILTYPIQGVNYPAFSLDELAGQMPSVKKKFNSYAPYAEAKIEDILSAEQLAKGQVLSAGNAETVWFENKGNGKFEMRSLPMQAQFAPVYSIAVIDANQDGAPDLLLAGNLERTRTTMGKFDANYGALLLNDGKGNFRYVPQYRSGLSLKGDVRRTVTITRNNDLLIFFGLNNAEVTGYRLDRMVQ
jgi:enediyne biosynthesis protein E4